MAICQFKLEEWGTVQFSFLPALIAEALHDDKAACEIARKEIAAELLQMVDDGSLAVRDPLTLEPLIFERGGAPGYGVLTTDDLCHLLESKGLNFCKSKKIQISTLHKSVSVEDAMTIVINAIECNDDVIDGLTGAERLVMSVTSNFMLVCESLAIRPCLPNDLEQKYTGEDGQSVRFEITTEEFERYAGHYGLIVELVAQATSARDAVVLSPVAGDDDGQGETTEERRARWLKELEQEQSIKELGALMRVYKRELTRNPKADRSYMGKQISVARKELAAMSVKPAMQHKPTANDPFGQATRNVDGKPAT